MRQTGICAALCAGLFVAPAFAADEQADRAICAEVVVPAERADVWQALTTTAGVRTFFAPHARVELRLNGPYEIYFAPDSPRGQRGSEGCRVLSYIPEEMLSFSWSAPPSFGALRAERTFVVIQLLDAGDGQTRVSLRNDGYGTGDEWDAVHAYFERAWPAVLGNLKKRFESGPLWPEAAQEHLELPERKHYVYFLRPVREDLVTGGPTPEERAPLMHHVQYIRELVANDVAVFAGPATGPQLQPSAAGMVGFDLRLPGVVVFKAENDEAARAIMMGDPAVKAGVFKACASPFNLAFRAK